MLVEFVLRELGLEVNDSQYTYPVDAGVGVTRPAVKAFSFQEPRKTG